MDTVSHPPLRNRSGERTDMTIINPPSAGILR